MDVDKWIQVDFKLPIRLDLLETQSGRILTNSRLTASIKYQEHI